jgi:hypothetical protein
MFYHLKLFFVSYIIGLLLYASNNFYIMLSTSFIIQLYYTYSSKSWSNLPHMTWKIYSYVEYIQKDFSQSNIIILFLPISIFEDKNVRKFTLAICHLDVIDLYTAKLNDNTKTKYLVGKLQIFLEVIIKFLH